MNLPGLVFLVDPGSAAYNGIANGGNVASLVNALGSGSLTSTEGVLPTRDTDVTLGDYPTIKFGAGSSLYTSVGGLSGNESHTIYMVVRHDLLSGYKLCGGFGAIGSGGQSGLGSGNPGGGNLGWAGGYGDIANLGSAPSQTSPGGAAQYSNLTLDTTTFHLLALTYDAPSKTRRLYVDGYRAQNIINAMYGIEVLTGTPSWPAGFGFMPHASGQEAQYHLAYAAFCVGSAHSASVRWQFEAWLRKHFGSSLGYPQTNFPHLVADGNSLTAGYGLSDWQTDSYCAQVLATLLARGGAWANAILWNEGIPGIGLVSAIAGNTLLTNQELHISGYTTGLAPSAILVDAGTNDLNYGATSAAAAYSLLSGVYLPNMSLYAPTAQIVVGTITPNNYNGISDHVTWEAQRQAYNTFIRNGIALPIFDPGASTTLSDPANTTEYQSDEIHWTKLGAGVAAALATAKIS